jgi:hypothetical protein
MTATAVDINIVNKEKCLKAYPVAASTTIYQGTLVALNSSGYLTSATGGIAQRFVGVASEGVDNSAGANAAKYCKVYSGNSNLFKMTTSGATINDVGRPVYCADNQTVQFASGNMFVGYCAEYVSATVIYVDIEAALWDESSVESIPVAASTTITAGTMVCLSGGYAVPAANTATYVFKGVAVTGADNSAGSAGDLSVLVKSKGTFSMTASGLGVTDAKAPVWVSNATTVTTTPGLVYAGVLSRYVSATSAPVIIDDAAAEGWTGAAAVQVARGRYFWIHAYYPTAIANNTVTIVDGLEFPVQFRVLRGYVTCSAAPSGAYVATVTITDGTTPKTVTVTGAAVVGETENINTTYAANTDMDITVAGDNASNAAAGFNIHFLCQEL